MQNMPNHDVQLRLKILQAVIEDHGPLQLQRKLQKMRLERPDLSWESLVGNAVAEFEPGYQLEATLASMAEKDIRFLTYFDQAYPLLLKGLEDPPVLLFYRGTLANLHKPGLAMVGARQATAYGRQLTRKIAGDLSRLGFVVISGLARGIDAAAHEASLEVGGATTGVLGSGLDRIYPAEHRGLAEAMVDRDQLLISEWPPGCPPKPHHFPIRNRLISGLSQGVIVIEAAAKSGSLITARHALDQGKHLFAVPGLITNPMAKGPNGLIARGEAQLFESVETVLEQLGPLLLRAQAHEEQKAVAIKDPLARKIYDTLDSFEPISLDLLTIKLGVPAPLITANLVTLESHNLVSRQPGPVFFRNPLQAPSKE